jgi:GxxExxY protein
VHYTTGMTSAIRSAEDLNRTTAAVIKAGVEVHRALGPGLFENAYRACLFHELTLAGFAVEEERVISLIYKQKLLDCTYRVDLDIDNCLLVEVNALESLDAIHFRQMTTYLRLTDYRVGLLMNFGSLLMKDGIHRIVNKFPRG